MWLQGPNQGWNQTICMRPNTLHVPFESMASFNKTCLHSIRKCYIEAEIEASVIVGDHFFSMPPRLQNLGSGGPNVPGEPFVFFVSTRTRWID